MLRETQRGGRRSLSSRSDRRLNTYTHTRCIINVCKKLDLLKLQLTSEMLAHF